MPQPNPNSARSEAKAEPKKNTEQPVADNRIYQSACPAVLSGIVIGKILSPISEGQCGERSPVEVTEIAGVKLTGKTILNCRMATSLAEWTEEANSTAEAVMKSKLTSIVSSTSYQCRRRNNAPTGKISEHGFANAFDIIGFRFENGKTVTLADDWPLPEASGNEENTETSSETSPTPELKFLKQVRDQACKRFTTVLGPESDSYHADHFHFDLGCHGKTCTYKICE